MKNSTICWLALSLFGCASGPAPLAMHERPLNEVTQLAEQGDAAATHDLCYRYRYGRHAAQNDALALTWCTRGAAMGIDSSQVLLAEIYYYGEGVGKDVEKARELYTAAADKGHSHALYMLYIMYDDGRAGAPDRESALSYLRRAADLGHERALKALARVASGGAR